MNSFEEIKKEIEKVENIVVTAHINPDGDAVGASLGLGLALKKIGKNVRIVLQDKIPDTTKFLKYSNLVEIYDENEKYDVDLVISVDCASKERLGMTKIFFEKDIISINIDHHISNPSYGKLNYVKECSSTSELIFNFITFYGIELDENIGEPLYVGLVNDTGNFKHSNVRPSSFEMAAKLVKVGVDNNKVVREFLNTKSYAAIKLLGKAMYDMKFFEEKKLSYYFMSYEELMQYEGRKEDTEGVVENLLSYDKANVSLFLREDRPGFIKGSMRSKHSTDVNKIAAIFNGGGHILAAGFSSELPAEKILEIVLDNL